MTLHTYFIARVRLKLYKSEYRLVSNIQEKSRELIRISELAIMDGIQSTSRTRPMRILVLGCSRTGTSSLRLALSQLGYRTFHMHDMISKPKKYFPFWINALKQKFGNNSAYRSQPLTRENLDTYLGDFDAVSDVPVILFAEELLQAYPEAKVILTTRDAEKWVDSMCRTIWYVHTWSYFDWFAPFVPLIRFWRTCDKLAWDAFINSSPIHEHPQLEPQRSDLDRYASPSYREQAIVQFNDHNEWIRRKVPKDNILEFKPQDGWKPLCSFLEVDVPEDAYPRIWEGDELVRAASMLWYAGAAATALQTIVPVCVAVGLGYWTRSRGMW